MYTFFFGRFHKSVPTRYYRRCGRFAKITHWVGTRLVRRVVTYSAGVGYKIPRSECVLIIKYRSEIFRRRDRSSRYKNRCKRSFVGSFESRPEICPPPGPDATCSWLKMLPKTVGTFWKLNWVPNKNGMKNTGYVFEILQFSRIILSWRFQYTIAKTRTSVPIRNFPDWHLLIFFRIKR